MSKIVTNGFLAGIDVSSAMVAYCEKHFRSQITSGKMELKCAAAESLLFPSATLYQGRHRQLDFLLE